jgi:long-chain-acyl-CoA dehydrogenase
MRRTLYGPDHEAFRDSAREFVNRFVLPRAEELIDRHEIPRDIWLEAGKAGFLGLEIPERFGGMEAGDYRFNAIVAEEFARANMALSSSMGIHSDITVPYIVHLGNEEQRERWLPRCATGELICAIGMTEPSGGSDLANLKTTAVRDGDDWILNGAKTFITNGYNCDLVVVAARTDPSKGAKGISLLVVERGMEGFENGRKLDKVGQPEADTAELFFKDVRVPGKNLLGEEGMGFISMMKLLPQERLGSAVNNVHHAKHILLETLEYSKERKAFGQAIGTMQYNKFLLAELVTKIEVAEAYVDQAVEAHADGKLTAVDAAKAKWWSAQTQSEVLDACVQIHGGYGYMNEYRVARAWRDARVTKIWAGTNEIMKELIGRDLGL